MRHHPPRWSVAVACALLLAACATPSGSVGEASSTATVPPASAARPSAPEASPVASPSATVSEESRQPTPTPVSFDDALLAIELRDVRTGETFTLGGLAADAPVIVETMAIWCTNCRQQMGQLTEAHRVADFHSVSIDVDPTEIADDLVAYADREGFDWPFVMADAELATMLRDRFGTAVLQPPGMPKLLIRTDGSIELLPLGDLLSADEIASLVSG